MHTTKRKVRDGDDANELLDAWRSSGLDLPAFCAQSDVDGRSLQCWATNLARAARRIEPAPRGRRAARSPRLRLVEVSAAPETERRGTYRVVVGTAAVEVDDNFREDTLARLLAVVGRC